MAGIQRTIPYEIYKCTTPDSNQQLVLPRVYNGVTYSLYPCGNSCCNSSWPLPYYKYKLQHFILKSYEIFVEITKSYCNLGSEIWSWIPDFSVLPPYTNIMLTCMHHESRAPLLRSSYNQSRPALLKLLCHCLTQWLQSRTDKCSKVANWTQFTNGLLFNRSRIRCSPVWQCFPKFFFIAANLPGSDRTKSTNSGHIILTERYL